MSEFHKEEDHKQIHILFDSFKIEEKFKANSPNSKYHIIKDKEEKRLHSMLTSASNIGISFIRYQTSAVSCIAMAKTYEEAVMIQTGLLAMQPNGIVICTACLDRAIATCEENLEVLKDIREATKQYATQS